MWYFMKVVQQAIEKRKQKKASKRKSMQKREPVEDRKIEKKKVS